MLQIYKASQQQVSDSVLAEKNDRQKLDWLRQQMRISCKELNRICREIVGREDFGNAWNLSRGEMRRVIRYLQENKTMLMTKYSKIGWGDQ